MKDSNTIENYNLHLTISQAWGSLKSTIASGDQKTFNEIFVNAIPELKKYITQRLKTTIKKGKLPKNKYDVFDFIDTLLLKAYDKVKDVKDEVEFSNWLFSHADELLEDLIIDEEFDDTFFSNIDDIAQLEWKSMEEEYFLDGDGDYVMYEDLNDPSDEDYSYQLEDVFIEHKEKDIIEGINGKIDSDEIKKHLRFSVDQLPISERIVFQLSTLHKVSVNNISNIRSLKIDEVHELLKNARGKIASSLISRFGFNISDDYLNIN